MLPHKRINANTKHPLYYTWNSTFSRCYYKSHKQYKDYGGRGIGVWFRWFDFESYVRYVEEFLGEKPTPEHTIDRIRTDIDYCPGNVRWSNKSVQQKNRRRWKVNKDASRTKVKAALRGTSNAGKNK